MFNNSQNLSKNSSKILVFFSFFLLLVSVISAQNPLTQHFGTNEGLPSPEVYHAFQDSKGYIWFSTNYGVSRFDGYKFLNFDNNNGLPDNTIFESYEDFKGRIWFISYSGKLSYFENNKIKLYKYNEILVKQINNKLYANNSFKVDTNDNLSINYSYKGKYSITNKGKITHDTAVFGKYTGTCVITSRKEPLVFTYLGEKMYYFTIINEKSCFKVAFLNPESPFNPAIFSIKTKENNILISENKTMYLINDSVLLFKMVMPDIIKTLYVDKNHDLWVGIKDDGVYRFPNCDIRKAPDLHLFSKESVLNILNDNERGFWFTTYENGVYYVPNINLINYTFDDKRITSMISYKKKPLLCFNNREVLIFYNRKVDNLNFKTTSDESINCLNYDIERDVLWFGLKHNIRYIKNKKEYTNHFEKWDLDVYYFEKSKTRTWVATRVGLAYIKDNNLQLPPKKENTFKIFSIKEQKNKLLLLATMTGLWTWENNKYIYKGDKNPLFKNRINCIEHYKDFFVIGTKGSGLYFYKNDTAFSVNTKNGLIGGNVKCITVDAKNQLWVGTNKGISKISQSKDITNPIKIESFNMNSGLISNDINNIVICNDSVYVSSFSGLSVFSMKHFVINSVSPPVYITKFSVFNDTVTLAGKLNLSYDQNTISVEYAGISFKSNKNLVYKYRLSGTANSWQYTSNTQIQFNLLPPGSYSFEVLARNEDGVYSQKPAIISFVIQPPFWRTIWFIFLTISTVLFIAWYGFSLRIKALKTREKLKQDILKNRQKALQSQMNPHFIFNSLNSIQNFILKNDKEGSTRFLGKFSRLMRVTLQNSEHQSIILRDEIDALQLYLDLEVLRLKDLLKYQISIDQAINAAHYLIPPLILQPFLENSIWHGLKNKDAAGFIKINISKAENHLLIMIEDNGIGRKKANEIRKKTNPNYVSFGSNITEKRLQLLNSLEHINSSVNYTDLYDENNIAIGTRVEISIPVVMAPKNN